MNVLAIILLLTLIFICVNAADTHWRSKHYVRSVVSSVSGAVCMAGLVAFVAAVTA